VSNKIYATKSDAKLPAPTSDELLFELLANERERWIDAMRCRQREKRVRVREGEGERFSFSASLVVETRGRT